MTQLSELLHLDQYLLSSCYETENVLEKSVPQADNKCKGPGAEHAEGTPGTSPHISVWLEQSEQVDNRGDEVRQEVSGD